MKKLTYIFVGIMFGVAIVVGAIFLCSLVLQGFGIQLYNSEADQQRNFNVVLLILIAVSLVGGWLGYRTTCKNKEKS